MFLVQVWMLCWLAPAPEWEEPPSGELQEQAHRSWLQPPVRERSGVAQEREWMSTIGEWRRLLPVELVSKVPCWRPSRASDARSYAERAEWFLRERRSPSI